jgi:hypothetical protein
MSLPPPKYLPLASIRRIPPMHQWNDWDPYALLGEQDVNTIAQLSTLSDRAQIAFSIACAEWVIWRFVDFFEDNRPYDLLEVAWAGEMSQELVAPPQLNEKEWKGLIRGPIDLSLVTILNTFYSTEDAAGKMDSAFAELIVLHVFPEHDYFIKWRDQTLLRLFELFGRTDSDPVGKPVPREAMDPEVSLSKKLCEDLAKQFLSDLDYQANPFLSGTKHPGK